MRSERIPFVVRFVRVTGKGRPLQGGCSFLMRFRLEGFSLSFLAWEKPFFFAPFIPLSPGLWYTGAQGGRMEASRRKRRRPGASGPLMNGEGSADVCNGRSGAGVGLAG